MNTQPPKTLYVQVGDYGPFASIPFPMSEEDFEMMLATLELWKKRIVIKPHRFSRNFNTPFVPMLPLL